MGLTIYYSGKLRNAGQLPDLTDEVAEVCRVQDWKIDFYFPTPEIPISGITFTPKGSEPVWMTFSSNGTLLNITHYTIMQDFPPELQGTSVPIVFTKTQYAGVDAHMKVIHLLRYLSQKYFESFDLQDEGEYWETQDESVLRKNFRIYDACINVMARKLSTLDGIDYDDGEHVEERIEKLLVKGISVGELLQAFTGFNVLAEKFAKKYRKRRSK